MALAVERLAIGNLEPAFIDAVLLDVRALLVVHANSNMLSPNAAATGVDRRLQTGIDVTPPSVVLDRNARLKMTLRVTDRRQQEIDTLIA
jgi:hypothetical protein